MKYSALEVLSTNLPTVSMRYEDAIEKYMEFPKMEWICKMGLNKIAKGIINSRYSGYQTGKVNVKGNTIYEILGLTKVNTRVLQAVDGNHDVLRLLQVAQKIGLQFKPEQLQEYYETFGSHKRSTEGMITRVKIIGQEDDDGRSSVEATMNGKTKYGVRQKIVTRGKDDSLEDAKFSAQEILDDKGEVQEEITVQAPDNSVDTERRSCSCYGRNSRWLLLCDRNPA
ncbi:hypothetical protein [Mediterraneibacter gnavus]|uniref:hypothetical protein n=1 Tax=Mediterraneibacter gnavus TaxID=33038 RepID=UPI0036D2BBF7